MKAAGFRCWIRIRALINSFWPSIVPGEIREAIDALPPKQLAAVLMHKYEGMDYVQIAEVLDCSIPALKSLLFRAYETLRRRLAHFFARTCSIVR